MPELPEVEIVRRGLEDSLLGLRIINLKINNPDSFIGTRNLINFKIIGLDRVGKCLIINLSNNKLLAIHLKMTGKLVYVGKDSFYIGNKHTHIIFEFSNKKYLIFNDVRKFGWVMHVSQSEFNNLPFIINLGPEPLKDFKLDYFKNICKISNSRIINLLLDQKKIAGIGNIYANEALYLSRINPKEKSSKLSTKKIESLFKNINKVLLMGLEAGGASMRDYVRHDGTKGAFQNEFQVYGNEAKLCRFCSSKIVREKLGSRSIFYCPKCQNTLEV